MAAKDTAGPLISKKNPGGPNPLARLKPGDHNASYDMTVHFPTERVNIRSDRLQFFALCAVLMAATFFTYWPVRTHDFVKYDDDKYVTDNRQVQSGLNERSVRWAFTSGYASNWHPVTWLSHMLDCELFGLQPRGPHLVNVLLHIANAVLLFAFLKRTTGAVRSSAFVAALFALHPLHVESVAWVAERKDVLSTFFWMLTMLAYARYADKPKIARYLLVLLLFGLGLMAKPMLVTLPFVLLLLDYWLLERTRRLPFRSLLLEKVPLAALAVASSIVTFLVQRNSGAVQPIDAIDLRSRLGNALVAYVSYIGKMFWPQDLAVLYPHPGASLPAVKVLCCGLLLIAGSICFLWAGRRRKYLAVGWLWYIVTLIPVIGLVQVGVQAMADRYSYVPLTGLFIMLTWGVAETRRGRGLATTLGMIAVVCVLAVVTSHQLRYWQNSVTLFEHTLAVTRDNYVMHNNYANFLMEAGRTTEAVDHFRRSLQIEPDRPEVRNNLGNAYSRIGKPGDAVEQYRQALRLNPNFAEAHYNLALVLSEQNRISEAVEEYREAIRLDPDNADALSNLGYELAQTGQFERAIELYRKALEIQPAHVITHGRLGLALAAANKANDAIAEFRMVLKARPDDTEMWCNLGILLDRQGANSEAVDCYRRALQVDPANTKARNLLDAAQMK